MAAYAQASISDMGDGTYRNPVVMADYSDPDVVAGNDGYFYLTASSFASTPGLPILRSADLVNWEIINHALPALEPREYYDGAPRHGQGVWAPCIRLHDDTYYIYWGDPDFGIFMVKSADPAGEWSSPILVKAGKGMIDPSPLWDDDGRVYLVHAWAASRAGFNSVLTLQELTADGGKAIGDEILVVDGNDGVNTTLEGPKFYKRDGWYYILAPAGGVATGWQLAMRSRSAAGPYELRRVMEQGDSPVNGPHQGGWVEDAGGDSWFLHFQDRDAYGRVLHLQPMTWVDGWPVIGVDSDGDGVGNPVERFSKPAAHVSAAASVPATSDSFSKPRLGLQWQWAGNPGIDFGFPSAQGYYRLYSHQADSGYVNLWSVPNLLLQKFPAEEFTATTRLRVNAKDASEGATSGLVVMGRDYGALALTKCGSGFMLQLISCTDADASGVEKVQDITTVAPTRTYMAGARPNYECDILLRVHVASGGVCSFSYSTDNGASWHDTYSAFNAREGRWIGAKVGVFSVNPVGTSRGWVDIDEFTVAP